jgi:hypothetical protein
MTVGPACAGDCHRKGAISAVFYLGSSPPSLASMEWTTTEREEASLSSKMSVCAVPALHYAVLPLKHELPVLLIKLNEPQVLKTVCNARLQRLLSPCMAPAGGVPRAQRCPLQRPLARRPLLPSQSRGSLFIPYSTVLWGHE